MFRSMNFAVSSCLVLLPLMIMAQPPRTTPNPGPVEELSIQPGDLPGSVVFSWEAPEEIGICDIEAYSVQVRTVVADGQEPTEIVPPSLVLAEPTSVPITNLPPCILLEFNINALNCAGLGPQTTLEGAAPGPECVPTDPVTPITPPERPELEVGEVDEEDEEGALELPEVEAPAVEEVLDEPAEAPQEISELELDDDVEADEADEPVVPDEPDASIACTNIAPAGEFTCADQNAFGKCTADFIVAGGFCDRECGRCPGVCADVVPPDAESCANRLAWGNCDEEWMVNGGFCEVTCGRCPDLAAVAGK